MLFALFANLFITPIIMSKTRLIGLYQILGLSMHKEVLEKSPLFQGMSNYQMRKAILISELREFDEGDLLVEQGPVGRNMYLILSGQVEVGRRSGNEVKRVAILSAGQILGEVGYIRETRRTADVKALTRVEALRFDFMKLKKDLKFFPHIVANLNFNISCILGERLANVLEEMAPQQEGESSGKKTLD
jgi:CRP-like cAMP-binding protein